MACVTDYNLIKEGDVYNVGGVASFFVVASGLESLYDGDISSTAFTIPSDEQASIEVKFGEYFDVCNLKYYASSLVLDDIEIGYGKDSYNENTAVVVSSGTFVYVDIQQPVGYIRITHSGTSSVAVQQLDVEGVLNDYIGVGTSSVNELSDYFLGNTPIKHFSSDYMEIPVFNEYPYDADIKVAVESTGGLEDNYVYISPTASGPYYGINDYGKRIPAFVPLSTVSDSLNYSTVSSIYSNWDVNITSETYLSLGTDYIQLNVLNNNNNLYRSVYGYNDMRSAFFVAKSYFTADQSFTVSLKVKYYNADFDTSVTTSENKVLLGVTDTFPIVENCMVLLNSREYPYHNRGTNSIAATWYGAVEDTDLRVGGLANNSDYYNNTDFNQYRQLTGVYTTEPLLSSIKMSDLSANVYGEDEYEDGTESAPWRHLKLSYDHTTKKCYYFVDDIKLGSFQFFSGSFFDSCKLFFGFIGDGPSTIQFKDFVVVKDKVLDIVVNQSSATALDSADSTNQGPEKLVDKRYLPYGSVTYLGEDAWVSGNDPQINDYFTVTFSGSQNLTAVRIKQIQSTDTITVSGNYHSANVALKRAVIDFDTGDTRIVEFTDPRPSGMDDWDVSYLLTTSGTIEGVYGVSSATIKYSTFYDRGSESALDVFGVDEIEFYNLDYRDVVNSNQDEIDDYTWSNGRFVNLKSSSSYGVYTLNELDKYEVATRQDRWKMFRYADYDGKSLVSDADGTVGGSAYHYGESLFFHTKNDGSERKVLHMKSGPSAWIWRYFPTKVNITAFYAYVVYLTSTVGFFHSRVDKWKLQYLIDDGNPNNVGDWVDIPPLTSAHSAVGYDDYTQYLVDHNDGEYYTDFASLYSSVSTFVTTSDLYCYKNVFNKIMSINNRSTIYVEFEETYYTQGIKLVIEDGFDTVTYPSPAVGYSINDFMVYADEASGFYLSPVFDCDTAQNTERIWTNLQNFDGASRVLYRASSTEPNYGLDPFYESWQDFGAPYSGLEPGPSFGRFYNSAPILCSDGNYIYVFPVHPAPQAGYVFRVDVQTNKWEEYITLDADVDGGIVAADPRTRTPVVYIGGAFLVATRSGDNPYTSGLSLLHIDETVYGYSGWENFQYQRQTAAVYATMVYDGSSRVFFMGEDLDITVFYKSTGELTTENRESIPGHGSSTRERMCAVYVNGKIYVVGGNSTAYLDIYDVSSDSWSSGASAPNTVVYGQILHVNGWLYVLPTTGADKWAPCMKYDIVNDTWYDIPSMNYNTATHVLDSQYGQPDTTAPTPDSYCVHGNYIYSMERLRSDFRRVKVVSDSWSSGEFPSYDITDSTWFDAGGADWIEVVPSGEFMPQDRYIQYKIDMSCNASGISPVVSTAALVQPITISGVPSGGSGSLYVKTNVSDDVNFDMWYTGRLHSYGSVRLDSILYTQSSNGTDFYNNVLVQDSYRYVVADGPFCFRDPCVLQDGSGFVMWAAEAEITEFNGTGFDKSDIYRSTSSNKYVFDSFSSCITKNTEGTYDTDSVYGPCILKEGTTYKIWYTGEDLSGVPRILYAESNDGITWSSNQLSHDINTSGLFGYPDSSGVRYPSVLKKDSIYWMYYEGVSDDDISSIIVCKSTDGLSWSSHSVVVSSVQFNAVYPNVGCGAPCVVDDADEMHMWFVAYAVDEEAIIYSKSVGGTTWSDFDVVIHRGEYGYKDLHGVSAPFVALTRQVPTPNSFMNVRIKMYND